MTDIKKTLRNLLLFVSLIAITFYVVLKNQNIEDIRQALKIVDIKYLLIGVGAMFLYFTFEAINLGRTLKVLGEKSSFLSNLRYAFIGFFFSAITPAASGGQPVQIYYMHKNKISIAHATLSLLVLLCSYHLVTISFALFSFIFNFNILSHTLRLLFVLGILLNILVFSIILIGVFSRRMSRALINFGLKILKFFKVKNINQKEEKLINGLEKYQGSAKYIKSHPGVMVKTFFTTVLQMASFFSISYWVYRSFGLTENNILQIITLQSILYATVCVMPLPGSVGISEGVFLGIYAAIYTESFIGTAMMLHRGISFYVFVIVSSLVVLANTIISNKKDKKLENNSINKLRED